MSLDKLAVTAGEMASSAEIEDFLHGALVSWVNITFFYSFVVLDAGNHEPAL